MSNEVRPTGLYVSQKKELPYKVENQYDHLTLLKEVGKINHFAPNQTVTSFAINNGGRTLLIGIDYNPKLRDDQSIHTVICNGTAIQDEGWSCNGNTEQFIASALKQVEQMLRLVIV